MLGCRLGYEKVDLFVQIDGAFVRQFDHRKRRHVYGFTRP